MNVMKRLVAAAVILAIPIFAACSLFGGSSTTSKPTELAAEHDRGFRVVEKPLTERDLSRPATIRAEELDLSIWTFTATKPKPSPFH